MTLFALCLGWVAGIAIEPSFDSPLWVWLAAGAALTAAGLFAVRGRARWTLLTAAAFAFGAAPRAGRTLGQRRLASTPPGAGFSLRGGKCDGFDDRSGFRRSASARFLAVSAAARPLTGSASSILNVVSLDPGGIFERHRLHWGCMLLRRLSRRRLLERACRLRGP